MSSDPNLTSSNFNPGSSFDVVDVLIVGAGPAGVVLAEQLSRDGTKSVVLIEAGPDSINNATVDSE